MKRRLLSIIVIATVACAAMANPVTKNMALQKARNFAKEKLGRTNEKVEMTFQTTLKGKEDAPGLYVCNMGDNKGFVILSGDDRAVPVLAYSDTGAFDANNIPENMKWWLQYYEEALEQVVEYQLTNKKAAARPTDVIKPLVKTQWDQMAPYNQFCPTIGNAKSPTGCVATAMAQVLNYHRCPVDSTNSIDGYTTYSYKVNMPKLEPTKFDWDNMLNTYGRNATQAQKDAVAELMLYCGQVVQMDYTPASSGANTDYLGYLLPRYFNIPQTVHNVVRYGYTIEQWDSIMINELKHNRPILYTGYTAASEGHAFVCDGYDGKGYYHINWGWGGDGDAYYRISVLDASSNGVGGSSTSLRFSVLQSAIIGITREGEDEFVPPTVDISAFSRPSLKNGRVYVRDSVGADFKNILVDVPVINMGEEYNSYYNIGLALYDDDGNKLKSLNHITNRLWPGYPNDFGISIKFGKGIEEGHYTIKTEFWKSGKQPQLAFNADANYLDVQIKGDTMLLVPVPKADFNVKSVRTSGRNVIVRLTNNDEEFNGFLILRKYNSQGVVEDVAMESVAIEKNSTRDIAIYVDNEHSIDLENEVYFLSVDYYEDQYFYTNAFNEGANLKGKVKLLNADDEQTAIVGDKVMCDITVANEGEKDYHHLLSVALVDKEGNETINNRIVNIDAGDSITYGVEFKSGNYDEPYKVLIKAYEGEVLKAIDETPALTMSKGALYWIADGTMKTKKAEDVFVVPDDALAINMKVAYTKNAVPNDNPNTVYMLDRSVPKGLMGKNVVNYEYKGGTISIDDNYDFYVSKDVTATVVPQYKRTITTEDLGKWSTLTLPFAPIAVSVDGVQTDWHKAGEDGESNNRLFWLMEIVAVEGDQMTLDFANEIKENTTYLFAPENELAGKVLLFEGRKNTTFKAGFAKDMMSKVAGYDIITNSVKTTVKDAYLLDGDSFVYADTEKVLPQFRACLLGEKVEGGVIHINGPALPDGIETVKAQAMPSNDGVYDLMGVYVGRTADMKNLPKGIYIVNGKKVVK